MSGKYTRKCHSLAIGGLLLGLLAGPSLAQDQIPVRFSAAANVGWAPVFVIADESTGIAAKHGLDADVKVFGAGLLTLEAALAGEVDVAFPNGRTSMRIVGEKKACFKAPITFMDSGSIELIGRTDLNSAADLVGAKIGTLAGSGGQTALEMWLRANNVDTTTVSVVNVAVPDMPIALAQGAVDAIIWTEPTLSQAKQILGDKVHTIGDIGSVYREVAPVNVTCSWAEKYGDDGMQRLTAAWINAVEYIKANPQPASEITGKQLRQKPEDIIKFWNSGHWLPDGWPADMSDRSLEMMASYSQYDVSLGNQAKATEFQGWYDSKWLKAVAPERLHLNKFAF